MKKEYSTLDQLFDYLDEEGAFDEEKWNFNIYKESCVDEWHVASQEKYKTVHGSGYSLESALLQALKFVLKYPNYYKTKEFKKK